ncbi:adipose-secreted signaling protein-like, partial [Saccoglossus kowalevskii]
CYFAGNSRVHIKTGVKFPVDVHEPDIIISKSSDSSVDVNIGFLQKDHRYEISFSVYDDVGSQVKVFPEQHFCIKLLSVYPQQSGDGHDIVMELITRKDGVMQEEFQLINETDENRKITVIIHARIL